MSCNIVCLSGYRICWKMSYKHVKNNHKLNGQCIIIIWHSLKWLCTEYWCEYLPHHNILNFYCVGHLKERFHHLYQGAKSQLNRTAQPIWSSQCYLKARLPLSLYLLNKYFLQSWMATSNDTPMEIQHIYMSNPSS